jgi:hypothetical protein
MFVCVWYIYYRLAEEELLREAQRGASRAAVGGALAWQKCPLQPTNKRFLVNMIQYTVNANKLKQQRQIKKYEITKHHSGHSVQKTNPSHSSRRNRKRTRDDTCNVQDDGQKKETHKRKASKKRDS